MELALNQFAKAVSVLPVQLDNLPPGLAVLRAPCELERLLDKNIEAAILLSADPAAAALICDGLGDGLAGCPVSASIRMLSNSPFLKYDVDYGYKLPHGIGLDAPAITPLNRHPLAGTSAWYTMVTEYQDITQQLGALFVAQGMAPYLDFHVAQWTDTTRTNDLHVDHDWQLSATHCRAPTVLELQGRQYAGPDYCYSFFKGNRLRHRKNPRNVVMPERPHTFFCWDVGAADRSLLR